jgi:hypothetical protein
LKRSHGTAVHVSVVACPKERTIAATFAAASSCGALDLRAVAADAVPDRLFEADHIVRRLE